VWLEETADVWKRAGFGPGQTLLDLGCGPGSMTLDLSKLVGPEGHVIALDISERFIEHVRARAAREGLRNIAVRVADIRHVDLDEESLDGAIARWVIMFSEDPGNVVKQVARALKPGGTLAVMEYFQFRSMSLWPGGEAFERVYRAVHELIRRHGGNPDIGGSVPQLMTEHGLRLVDLHPTFRTGRPGSPLWEWLEMTGRNHDNLVKAGLLTDAQLQEYYRDWSEHARNPNAFFTAPPLLATIGVKTR
jgi:SAM-dependent methyltransferase